MSSSIQAISDFIPFHQYILDFFQIEDLLQKPPNTKEILSKRKNTFIKEYLKLNNISIYSTCSVKTENAYKTGHLTLNNSKLIINQYESNKINKKYKIPNSIVETVDIFYPIFFIDFKKDIFNRRNTNRNANNDIFSKTSVSFIIIIHNINNKFHFISKLKR